MSKLIAISSPSGGGKTTIVKEMLQKFPELKFSVSATTRAMRENEKNGKEYFFITKNNFENAIKNNELVEYEEIYGNYYGTLKSEIDKTVLLNKNMLFDVDVKGALSIKKCFPNLTTTIFISPPSISVLKDRLINRKTENLETIERRISRAEFEIELGNNFDFVVENNQLEKAIFEIEQILNNLLNN